MRFNNKYGAKLTEYNGKKYHSKREAAYAEELDWRLKAGDIKSWRGQVNTPLAVAGNLICRYIVDFVITENDGTEKYIEVKGYWTPEAKLKLKLFNALYPDIKLEIVK